MNLDVTFPVKNSGGVFDDGEIEILADDDLVQVNVMHDGMCDYRVVVTEYVVIIIDHYTNKEVSRYNLR